jgi:uncharacterized membrane protein
MQNEELAEVSVEDQLPPRLVLWVAHDRVISHSLWVFTATFPYALAALGGVARSGGETVPFISAYVVVGI